MLRVSKALSANDRDWSKRDGKEVRLPDKKSFREQWPPKRVLRVQKAFYTFKQQQRQTDRLKKPHECRSCSRRFVSNGQAFKLHTQNCTARRMPGQFTTPQPGKTKKASTASI